MIINSLIVIFTIIVFIFYIRELKNKRLKTRELVIIGVMSAASFILHTIQFIKYPQGGGITLLSMLPILLLSIIYGARVGMTSGLIVGILELLIGGFVVHPVQILLDYILSNMFLGLSGIFGSDKKYKYILGSGLAMFLSLVTCIISGVVFFGNFAPKGMNVLLYSIIYNGSSMGVESVITLIVLFLLPINKIKRIANK
ncbi:energy-coupled thiamine transporter ThiT [Clostridium chrysemydis]|uniref:energy-coupled thiamine transporter ThiT n=1 Tax=Clostridium chrysemydis TaxID=2665504 RepID=UPI003F3F7E46